MSGFLPTPQDVRDAAARIAPHIVRTPMLRHRLLDEMTGGTILVKPEVLQRTGSFKLRGATNAAMRLPDAARVAGVVTHSSGNHGQAVACASAMLGMPALIAMPMDAPAIKVESTRRWGAEITFFDRKTTDRETLAARLAEERGGTVLRPSTRGRHRRPGHAGAGIVRGCEGGRPDAGCAGGLHGRGRAHRGLRAGAEGASPGTAIWAVEPEGWDDTKRSLEAGARIANDGQGETICDALLSMRPGEITFAVNQPRLAGAVVVTRAEVFRAMRFAFEHLKIVVEPGGAVALAAVLAGKVDARGKVVGIVVSGGNVDPAVFAEALAA